MTKRRTVLRICTWILLSSAVTGLYARPRAYASPAVEYDYVDSSISDVDASADKGTHSDFAAQQYGPDSVYDTLVEEGTAGGITYENSAESYSATGQSSHSLDYSLQKSSENDRLIVVTVSWEDQQASAYISSMTFDSIQMVHIANVTVGTGYSEYISLWYLLDSSLPSSSGSYNVAVAVSESIKREIYMAVAEYSGAKQSAPDDFDTDANTSAGNTAITLTAAADGSVVVAGVGEGGKNALTNTNNLNNLQEQVLTSSGSALGHHTNVDSGDIAVGWNNLATREGMVGAIWQPSNTNYELDLEVKWTSAGYTQTNEELCIFGGTMGLEDIWVDVWSGSTWHRLFTDLLNGWNNISVTDYLDSPTFTIRFKGATETGDTSQDSWEIDCTLLRTCMHDTIPPIVSIISPENEAYSVTDVPLTFTVGEATSWIGYSLDNQANVTIDGNTILIGLSDGPHSITVYANDTAGNMGSSDTVYFTIDTALPRITILSPENKTYAENVVPLSFTVDESVSWMAYSLDGQANVTITGDTTLASLGDGMHYVVVYANDTVGKMGASSTVYFTVDTEAPIIIILSPKNETYASTSFSLNFTQSEPTSWMGYSLDGQANNTVTENTTLIGLSDGMHSLVVYASDMLGNTGHSDIIYFTIDTVLPIIELLSPENKTYGLADVPLSFTVSEKTSWMGYSLDGQTNETISGNITFVGLSDGIHNITVYANDTAGNMGSSDTVYFTINALPPNVELFSPENKTYATNSVSLSFAVNEPTLWKGYSLDGQANVTIFGDTTLAGLSEGSHSVVVYAKDMAGNAGTSGIVYFAVETRQPEPSQLWIVVVIAIVAGVGFALTAYMAYDLFKRAQK